MSNVVKVCKRNCWSATCRQRILRLRIYVGRVILRTEVRKRYGGFFLKITDMKTFIVSVPRVYGGGPKGAISDRVGGGNWLFVKIYTDEGITGVGEGTGWPAVTKLVMEEFKPFLIGEDPFGNEKIWLKLWMLTQGHGVGGAIGLGAAISGIDMALWDLKGKALNTPVYNLLGGKCRDKIKVYGHANDPETAQKLLDKGCDAFKCNPTVSTFSELRDAVGYDVFIGAHGGNWPRGWTPHAAITLAKKLERYEPWFFEEPTGKGPMYIEHLAKIARKVDIPIATGERIFSKWWFANLIYSGIVDIVQPEITRLGGITEEKKLAAMAEAACVTISPHNGTTGPVGDFANVHVMASIPNTLALEQYPEQTNDEGIVPWRAEVATPLPIKNGYIEVPNNPGLGIEINEEYIAKHPPKPASWYRYAVRPPEETNVWDPHLERLERLRKLDFYSVE